MRPGYALDQTQNTWREVENANGYISFRDAAVTGGEFQAELEIKPGFFTSTWKPVCADFLVTLYGVSGQIVARGTRSVYSISSGGGSYLVEGLDVADGSSVASCSIRYVSAWVPRS